MNPDSPTPEDHEPEAEHGRPGFAVVGIGASAGCIDALTAIFSNLPDRTGMAFVVIVHLSPRHESRIDRILGGITAMPVLQVKATTKLAPDHIYVIPPGQQLAMHADELQVSVLNRPPGRHVAIDLFFRTLAETHRERAVGIVLSGSGADGSIGLRRIKERGGLTLVQAPADAEFNAMPLAAIATGSVDFVLPAAELGPKLVALWANMQDIALPELTALGMKVRPLAPEAAVRAERAFGDVLSLLRTRTGHDFRRYKRATVLRRVERRMQVNALPTLPDYLALLESNVAETSALLQDLLISVTNFFRDRESFEVLDHELDAAVAAQDDARPKLRAWVAGCATGEEAYSVAMMLNEKLTAQKKERDFQVFASDIDERAIAIARTGLYPDAIVNDVTPSRLRRFFDKEQGQVRVRKELRERILFATHNLLRDPPFSNLDLVCCRNVLIYLEREVQLQVLQVFHFALRPGGLLFLGSSETADAAGELFVPVDKKHRIYRANGAARVQLIASPPLQDRARLFSPAEPPAVRTALADLHARLLEQQSSPSVLIDEACNILHSTARTGRYLRFAPGQPTRNLLEAVRPELRLELRAALLHACDKRESVEARRVQLDDAGRGSWVTMTAKPIDDNDARFVLVLFDEVHASLTVAAEDAHRDPVMVLLEEELQRTREQLQGSMGHSATSTEELRASNEELQAINEELRSATEELETSKEELQSVNEELITVNQELKAKIDEAGKVNDDLKNLIASTDIATVFVDRTMRIRRFTPRASHLFNLIAPDVGRSLLDITHRLDYDRLEADAAEAFDSLRTVEREVGGPDGATYLVRVLPYRTNENLIDGAVFNFVDISAVRRAEENMRVQAANLSLVVESAQDYAIVTLDIDGLVTSWNPGAVRMFGYEEAEMRGQSLATTFTPQDRQIGTPQAEIATARDTGRAAEERWQLRKDGSLFYCSAVVTPTHDHQKLVGFAKIARDLTESKRAETQLEALLEQEKRTRSELQRAIALKDEFLAVMSHELKHPLNLIHVNAELLARLPEVRDTPSVARATDVIRRTVMSQAKIIDDLLDLSRVRTGKLALSIAPVQWATIVTRAVDAMREEAFGLGLTLTTTLDPAASKVRADPVRVEQIVWNLISNALKFTPPGGSVQVNLRVHGAFSRLDVIDTGQGLDADFRENVFDMFRQANRGSTRPQGGMGIGLALVKQLAEEHGGRVAVRSDGTGLGSTFSVWLPRELFTAADSAGTAPLPALSGLRILLVDDADVTLESFTLLLRLEGAEVVAAASAAVALAEVERADFDLVISDIAMPGMDGHELVRRLRLDPRTADLAAIALTGFGRPQDAQQALAAGFDAHLAKPVVIEELFQAVRRLPKLAPRRTGG